jgi:FMN phosphatase YigB (HAD superfamily)
MACAMKKQELTPQRTHWIHDFDGVHYDTHLFDDVYGNIYQFYGQAKLITFRKMMPGLEWSDEKIIAEGKKSFLKHKDGLKVYVDFALASGMTSNPVEYYEDFHRQFHKHAFDLAFRPNSGIIIQPDPGMLSLMGAIAPVIRHGLVTMSCLQTWAAPFLEKMDMLRFFDSNALIGAKEADFLNKKNSTRPLQIGMEKLGARPEQTVFIEDTIENLVMAKKLDNRILTIWIPNEPFDGPLPESVDIRVPRLKAFLAMAQPVMAPSIKQNHNAPQPIMV